MLTCRGRPVRAQMDWCRDALVVCWVAVLSYSIPATVYTALSSRTSVIVILRLAPKHHYILASYEAVSTSSPVGGCQC
jgi:hypothetical protein